MKQQMFSCGCIGQISVKEDIRKSDAVFIGKILKKDSFSIMDTLSGLNINKERYQVQVETIYKGRKVSNIMEITTGVGNGDCGFVFTVGETYIIYANYKSKYYGSGPSVKPFLYTDICKRTVLKNNTEISQIEKEKKPKLLHPK